MAVRTLRLGVGADGNFAAANEVDQTAASRTDGWTVAKIAATNQSDLDVGVKQASGTFAVSAKPASFLIGSTANAIKSATPYAGTFAATAWTITFAVRAGTASSQAGRMRLRVFASVNADGSSARELTGSTQVGTTSAALSTTADATSVVTWSPGAITLNNEYLFFVVAWEITTASGSNSGDVVLRTGQSAGGTRIVTPDLAAIVLLAPGQIGATSTVAGAVRRTAAVKPAQISAASTVGGSIRTPRTLSITPTVHNYIPNPSFEVDVSGWNPQACTIVRDTTQRVFGVASAKTVSTVDGGSLLTTNYLAGVGLGPIYQGRIFSISMYVKGVGSAIGRMAQIYINESGGVNPDEFFAYNNIILDGTWQRLTGTGPVARADRTNLYAVLYPTTGSGLTGDVVYIDAVQLNDGAAIPYADIPGRVIAAISSVGGSIQVAKGIVPANIRANAFIGSQWLPIGGAPILDNFNRADGSPGANWTPTYPGTPASFGRISGNQFLGYSDWIRETFNNDVEIGIDLTAYATNQGWDLALTPAADPPGGPNAYDLSFDNTGPTDFGPIIWKRSGGTWSHLSDYFREVPQAGDRYIMRRIGNTLQTYRIRGGVTVQMHNIVDSEFSGPWHASIGTWLYDGTILLDNFRAANALQAVSLGVVRNLIVGTIAANSTVSGSTRVTRAITPAQIGAASSLSGSVRVTRRVVPASIAAAASVTGAVRVTRRVTPTTISATSSVSGVITRLRRILPTTISAAASISGSIQKIGAIKLISGTLSATSTVSGAIRVVRATSPAQISATAVVSGSVRTLRRIAPASISASSAVSGSIVKRVAVAGQILAVATISGTVQVRRGILPGQVNAFSTLSGSLRVVRRVVPAQVGATSTLSGSVVRSGKIAGQVNATSTVSGSIKRLAGVLPATISASSTVTGKVVRRVTVVPGLINSTSTVSGRVGVVRVLVPGLINSKATIFGTIGVGRVVFGNIFATSTVSGEVERFGKAQIQPFSILATTLVSGSVFRYTPTVTYSHSGTGVIRDRIATGTTLVGSGEVRGAGSRVGVGTVLVGSGDVLAGRTGVVT